MSKRNFGNDGIQSNATKCEKNFGKTLQSGNSASGHLRMRGNERLSGGADAKSMSTINTSKHELDTDSKLTPESPGNSKVAPEAEKEIQAILAQSNDQESTGDKKVDEMIDYVIQNLQEAGKALASLGENFEHDLKLMLVDIMGKVQNWVSVAQIRLDAARNDINNLRRELASRSNELAARDQAIAEMKAKLAESEVAKGIYEKALNGPKNAETLPSPSALNFIPSREPLPTKVLSTVSEPLRADIQQISGTGDATSETTVQSRQQNLLETQDKSSRDQRSHSQQRFEEEPATANVAVQYGKVKERKRESELESELARLRKENERIAKERADYENAIQRALLRGVSCLNAETLKVLRCPPPVSCYTPCGPPPSPVNTVETMTPCFSTKIKNDRTDVSCRKAPSASSRRGCSKVLGNESPPYEESGCCSAKKLTNNQFGSSSKYRKSSGNCSRSMALILQQATAPVACNAPCDGSQPRSVSRAKSRKLETSICTRK